MKLRLIFVLIILIALSINLSHSASGPKAPPRFTPATDGKPGTIELEQYFQMDDLDEAGRLLLQEAQLAQLDVDSKADAPMPEILLQSGSLTPSRSDRHFFEKHGSSSSSAGVSLIKFSRAPTIREFSEILRHGIRLYRGIPYNAYVATVPNTAVDYLSKLQDLEWAGEYLSSYKYDPADEFQQAILVYTLPTDRAESRTDLAQLGASVVSFATVHEITYQQEYYVVNATPAMVQQIASLWWVQKIEPAPIDVDDE